MITQSYDQGIVWELRYDATLLPLPSLVLNLNSHIFASLIFYPGHAVPPRTTLCVSYVHVFIEHPQFQTFPLHLNVS